MAQTASLVNQRALTEQFGVVKSVISRDLAWVRKVFGEQVEWAQRFSLGGDYLPLKLKTIYKRDRVIYRTWADLRWEWLRSVTNHKGVILISECL